MILQIKVVGNEIINDKVEVVENQIMQIIFHLDDDDHEHQWLLRHLHPLHHQRHDRHQSEQEVLYLHRMTMYTHVKTKTVKVESVKMVEKVEMEIR